MSKITNKLKTSFQNSQSKIKNSWDKFRQFSLATKSVIIMAIVLSLIGLTASILIIGSFIFVGIQVIEQIKKVDNFESCSNSSNFDNKVVHKAVKSEDFEFASCVGHNKEFYVKYKKSDSYEYKKYQILNKTDFDNQVKLAQNKQDLLSKVPIEVSSFYSPGLIGGNPNPSETLRKFSQDFFPTTGENKIKQKTKIDQIDQKITKIDPSKNPKPWSLVRAEFHPTNFGGGYSVNKLVDTNLNEVLPSFNDSNMDNSNSMKPIWVESSKTLYFPYRYGKIAVLNVETGDLKWDTFDFEIAQMSLFGGKYYLNEYKEICDSDKSVQTLTCNLFEIDRNNLKDRKVALEDVKNNNIVAFADAINVWLRTINKDRYNSYGQSSSQSDFTSVSFSSNESQKFAKYTPKNDKFAKYKSKTDSYNFDNYAQISFDQTKDLFGISLRFYKPQVERKDETVKNCPKSDRQNSCWSEIEKLVNKYRTGLEFKDEELEKFWSNLKENKPKILEIKCGELTISGQNLKSWKYKNDSISNFEPFGNLKTANLECFS